MKTRIVVALAALIIGSLAASAGCGRRQAASGTRVIVLGFDGMDHQLTKELMTRGKMPAFSTLETSGSFSPLETSVPPQSPVAWSSFITGLDPGEHGIFDFIHRDPETMIPYISTTETQAGGTTLKLGKWQFPLSGGSVKLLRAGQPFWEVLEDHGVETTIVRMPANYPPSGSATRELSGMGTPDITGNPGWFSFYTSKPLSAADRDISGGEVHYVEPDDHVVRATLYGPDNPFFVEPEKLTTAFSVYIDPARPVAKLVVGDEERILQVGEWTGWVPFDFDLIPLQTLRGMSRFYLKQVRPDFQLYASPINFDPTDSALPISTPASFAADLASASGRFYTQGFPEDTKSLQMGIFTADEFLTQARLAGDEVRDQYRHVLDQFDDGLLFYYFGNLDQISHMMFRVTDPEHPAYDFDTDPAYRHVIEELYVGMDEIVADTLAHITDDTTLIVMSDHGFTSWRRAFHLNSWLRDNGYLRVRDRRMQNDPGFFTNVDWAQTRAYGLGLNGLYLNLRGRERQGIVAPEAREALMDEIARKLLETIDPATDQPAVTKVYNRDEVYSSSGFDDIAPDLIIGYAKGTRCSFESSLGAIPEEVIVDNLDPWSGDHCMDHEAVPGILLTNRPLRQTAPSLERLAAAILAEFGIEEFPLRVEGE